jgi:predicted enzyme related to lactoylglutathione lyase
VVAAPFDVEGAGRMSVVQDPMGALFVLWEAREHFGARLVNEPGALCWNELITSNRERAAAFYGKLFGWSSRTYQLGPVLYTEFHRGSRPVAGMTETSGLEPSWSVSFAVADAEATAANVERLGGRTIRPVSPSVMGLSASFADPHGAVFSVVQQPESCAETA